MRISTRAAIQDVDGAQVMHTGTQRPATFASVVIPALAHRTAQDREVEELGLLAFVLAKRVHASEFIDISPDDAQDIRRRILAHPQYNNIVIGRVCEMLDAAATRHDAPDVAADITQHNVTPLRKE